VPQVKKPPAVSILGVAPGVDRMAPPKLWLFFAPSVKLPVKRPVMGEIDTLAFATAFGSERLMVTTFFESSMKPSSLARAGRLAEATAGASSDNVPSPLLGLRKIKAPDVRFHGVHFRPVNCTCPLKPVANGFGRVETTEGLIQS